MNVQDILKAIDVAEQLESIYDFLGTVLRDEKDIYYHGAGERTVSDEIKQSVIAELDRERSEAREIIKSHLDREIVNQEE